MCWFPSPGEGKGVGGDVEGETDGTGFNFSSVFSFFPFFFSDFPEKNPFFFFFFSGGGVSTAVPPESPTDFGL